MWSTQSTTRLLKDMITSAEPGDLAGAGDGLREGGLLADPPYAYGFRNTTGSAPDASGPASDLLRGSQQAFAGSRAWTLAGWAHAVPDLLTNLAYWLLLLLAIFLMLSDRQTGGAALPKANAAPVNVRPAR